jgi:hypothetical protein
MIKLESFFVILLVLFLSSCSTLTQETRSPSVVSYDEQTLKVESKEEGSAQKKSALFEVTYPVFSGLDTTISKKLQREIELAFSMGDPEAEEKTLRQIADEFIKSYKTYTAEVKEASEGWYYKGKAKVNVLKDTLISVSIDEEYYSGGAHGGTGKYFVNINPRSGNFVKLQNVFKPGFEEILTRKAEQSFRASREMADTATYKFRMASSS